MAYNSHYAYADGGAGPSYGGGSHYSSAPTYPLPSYSDYALDQGAPPPVPGKQPHHEYAEDQYYHPQSYESEAGASRAERKSVAGGALMRSDTLGPTDSVSQYQQPVFDSVDYGDRDGEMEEYADPNGRSMRGGHQAQPSVGHSSQFHEHAGHRYQNSMGRHALDPSMGDESFSTNYQHDPRGSHGYDANTSAANLPLRGYAAGMGYAEDEEDEARQRHMGGYGDDKPILFSNHTKGLSTDDLDAYGNVKDGNMHGHGGPFNGLFHRGRGVEQGEGPPGGAGPGYAKGSLQEAIDKRRRGIGRQRWAPVSYLFTVVYLAVFIAQLVRSAQLTGTAFQTKPQINPMIGPSSEFLINFGARFVPCMRMVPEISAATSTLPCLNQTNSDSTTYQPNQLCTLAELCKLSNANQPDQKWRLISAIFLHAGIVHILFNLIAQLTICVQIEKLIGSFFYTPIYLLGGLGGNLLGANFGLIGLPSVGASGAIFTCIGIEIVDLIYNWKYEARAKMHLALSIILALITFGIGLLPGLDNFAHIGGFAVGIFGGMMFAPSVHATKTHRTTVWVFRMIGAGLLAAFMIGLGLNFVNSTDPSTACSWCRYLSCLRTFTQCQGVGGSFGSTTGTSRRSLFVQ